MSEGPQHRRVCGFIVYVTVFKFHLTKEIKFNENPFSGSRVIPCGMTNGQTHKTKVIVTFFFAIFANALKNYQVLILSKFVIQGLSFAYLPEFKMPENEDKVSATEFVNFLSWFRLIQIQIQMHCNICSSAQD